MIGRAPARAAAGGLLLAPLLALPPALLPAPAVAQAHAHAAAPAAAATAAPDDSARQAFARRAREGTARFRDRRAAISAGYRRLGMDFPAMGEHWVNPGLVIGAGFDAARPAMLSYVRVNGEPVLAGVVYAVPLGPGERPPAIPDDASRWHEHNGTVDEESVLPGHDTHASDRGVHEDAAAEGGVRLAILHAWTEAPNPAGLFATDNWSLPFVRLGLAPPLRARPDAARALSLAAGGEAYYLALLAGGAALAPDVERAARAELEAGRAATAALLARPRAGPALDDAALDALGAVWSGVVARLSASVGAAAAGRLTGGA